MDTETYLQEQREALLNIVRPYQIEINRRQRMADFINQCIRCVERDDFLQLDELLRSKPAETIESDELLQECGTSFESLRAYASEQVDRYRLQFIEDLTRLAEEAKLAMEIDFPHFYVLKGIEGTVDFSKRVTVINKKTLKSVDPRRIVTAAGRLKKQLYDRAFDPQQYIDDLYDAYKKILKKDKIKTGQPVPIQRFYLEYLIQIQSKAFFTNMDKSKFRGYSLDQFVVDLWCFFDSDVSATSDGKMLKLSPGRNYSLWLIDSDGERRQITAISFQE